MELELVERATRGDGGAFEQLVEPWRRPLFRFIYRMVSLRQDAEDIEQEVLLRAFEHLPSYRKESSFKSWLFGIAAHLCLDHLRARRRWRVEAQLEGERETEASPEALAEMESIYARPDFSYEIREHVAFCFSCLARTLEPEQQAAVLLKEVLGFTAEESAKVLEVSEPVFRHKLSAARKHLAESYEGLCQLINKTGACWQCQGLREFAPEWKRGEDLVRIEVAPGVAVTADSLLDARMEMVRVADLENGRTRALHDLFFGGLTAQAERR
jgi:RNA polymerase sigma-70 factor (ECF subfamily)